MKFSSKTALPKMSRMITLTGLFEGTCHESIPWEQVICIDLFPGWGPVEIRAFGLKVV